MKRKKADQHKQMRGYEMKKKILLGIAALLLTAVAAVGTGKAYAYFTTYVEAKGGKTIHLGDSTTMEEDYKNWQKAVTISNSADSAQAVWVRAQAFSGSEYKLLYGGDDWSASDDGWYYFSTPVIPGGNTTVLTVSITGIEGDAPELEEGQSFNVVVVYETIPAVQNGEDESGNIQYVPYTAEDWSQAVTNTDAGGGE